MRDDGCHVLFDLDTDRFEGSKFGAVEAFFPAYEKYIPDLLAGKAVPSIESREQYVYVLTILTPLEGTDSVYVGADCSMEALRDYVRHVIGQV